MTLLYFDNACVGELEASLIDSFLRAAKLRRWLNRPDCPEALRQVKRLFDKAYGSLNSGTTTSDADGSTDRHASTHQSIPIDLSSLLPPDVVRRLVLVAHCKHESRTLSRASTHVGNSLVLYYPRLQPVTAEYGSIQYIYQVDQRSMLAVRRHLPTSANDPFKHYADFPATVRSAELGPLELVDRTSVVCHFLRWKMPTDVVVVLPLYKVSSFLSFHSDAPRSQASQD